MKLGVVEKTSNLARETLTGKRGDVSLLKRNKSMYKYLVIVSGSHLLGHDFLRDVVSLVKDGAELDVTGMFAHNTSFPPRCYMTLESESVRESTASVKFNLVSGAYTKEELEEMKWDDLKAVCKEVGITGRDRELIITAYLERVKR
jgi:hypothetical protein